MARLDWRARLVWLPAQTPGLAATVGLSQDDVERSAWAVLPDGERRPGAGAIAAAVDQLLPGGWPLASAIYRLPGKRHFADAAYRWVARNRHRVPGVPACRVGQMLPELSAEVAAELDRRGRLAGWGDSAGGPCSAD